MIQQWPSRVFSQIKNNVHTKACTWMFIVAIIPPNWKQPRYPLKEEQLNWLYHTYVIEYYSAIKWTNCWYTQPGWNSRDVCKVNNNTVSKIHPCAVLCLVAQSCQNSLWPHGLSPTRLLCPWGVSRQEYWSGLPCPPPGDLPNSGIEPRSPKLQVNSFLSELPGKPILYDSFIWHSPKYIIIEREDVGGNGCHGLRRWLWRCGVTGWECVWLSKTAGGIPVVMEIFWILTVSISIFWLRYHSIAL